MLYMNKKMIKLLSFAVFGLFMVVNIPKSIATEKNV